ncbi:MULTISPECIES: valine--tRNA ligase [Streptomyces]|uniref:Valine--tRNA ligase n=1 Tax=Streptomyces tsukubensis (strain DSM 42081 / NBRC 108919 / NRRL 18488 / 9993) TaxID=1114943 RepID=I2MY78_STRT9|nr:valine--tRNA ligase [Streptomyces tsukubensis]MYS62685.1 valine--tRNA ligase [Streptomyces sp. SID5473]AZK94062.1 valine--tRNA ligase [Streptomyces tsukubensis]EIF89725.1 valyl-tRNA synthetase [Streptomyces tsukubensis NRRL18488]QKM69824.1 valine--tRNA ligase [Streptomyces tsukubensis NRRL18488]TAI46202.1 valine--tRNA ligase [Streptomyces tsukubensis]
MTENTQQQPASTPELPTQYAPAEVEGTLYERWVGRGYFEADAKSEKTPYTVVIPPPNVTGSLHMGHAFEHTLIDALTRRKRMQGYETLWQPGMDHAGIATQNVVERELAKEGKSRHDLGREAFVDRVWQWKAESGGQIQGQMRRLGEGVAWSRDRFTMDEGLSRAVRSVFKKMYDDGLIYRAERIINWCPRCLTAISDIEVDYQDDDGELVSLKYGEGDETLVVATTRAETMLGDTAVAVHPDDERYAHLIGKRIKLPLTDRSIPVVADTHVDPEFGTGAVKVTPAHDPNDFAIGQRHGLESIEVLDERGIITVHGPFQGLDRFEARSAIVAALRAEGRIVAEKRPYTHSVGHCSRCRTTLEPRVSLQWWVKVEPLAKAAGDAVREGKVAIHPADMTQRYYDWVDNMHDWCISRQLWWGHRIPVWHGPNGEMVAVGPDEEPPAGEGWEQDPDVLDTWFSSGLWPFSTLGWPEQTPDLEKFYSTDVLVTGYDLMFFWVARMMMFGLYAMDGEPPFRTVAFHGMVRDEFGKKMSKSAGNTVNPLDWMDTYGSDAVRFTLARGANPGTDVPIGEDWVQASRNFANKIWNATRFALMNGATVEGELPAAEELSAADRWILSRLNKTVADVDAFYDDYQFAKLSDALYHFAWDEVFDWYVELSKTTYFAGGDQAKVSARVLGEVLDVSLRLLHPVMPFVTEALWTTLTGRESVVVADWPADSGFRDEAAEREIELVQRVVTEVRRFRSDQGLQPGQKVPARLDLAGTSLAPHEAAIRQLLRLQPEGDSFSATATLPVAGASVALDLSGTIDVAAERKRLAKDLAVAEKEKAQAEAKLGNEAFLAKAPDQVVDKIRGRLASAEADIARITNQLAALPTA